MDILSGIGGVNALLNSATALVRHIKSPRISRQDFAALLREEMHHAHQRTPPEAARNEAIQRATTQFMSLHDTDGDGLLSLEESGWDQKLFEEIDTDASGRVSMDELRQASKTRLAKRTGALHTEG